jgi:RNA recognition motif-containing protein
LSNYIFSINTSVLLSLGNFDEKVSERILYEILIQAGPVIDLHIPFDKENSRLKGYAFAEYETEEIAQYAVKLFSGLVRINDKALKFVVGFRFIIFYPDTILLIYNGKNVLTGSLCFT